MTWLLFLSPIHAYKLKSPTDYNQEMFKPYFFYVHQKMFFLHFLTIQNFKNGTFKS